MKVCWMQTRYFSPIFWSLICHATRPFCYRLWHFWNYLKMIPLRKRRFGVKRSQAIKWNITTFHRKTFFRKFGCFCEGLDASGSQLGINSRSFEMLTFVRLHLRKRFGSESPEKKLLTWSHRLFKSFCLHESFCLGL